MNFPEIELQGLDGKSHSLPLLIQGNPFNLILFYNTNCLGCTGRAIPLAYKLEQAFDFINLIVIHSNFRPMPFTKDEVLSVFTNHESPMEIYRETKHELYDYFDCDGTPHWLIMTEHGEVVHSLFGSQDGAQLKLEYAILEYQESI
ncbi:MAG: hypothetical protein PHQ74_05970 [Crocinitomicaceae bacterium]|nr:hypothetical protein [Crocinitomicaceae bacterium]